MSKIQSLIQKEKWKKLRIDRNNGWEFQTRVHRYRVEHIWSKRNFAIGSVDASHREPSFIQVAEPQ